MNWFINYIDPYKLIEKGYKIWLAQYYKEPQADFKINYWQYTSKGQVHGIEGNVDLDICYDDILLTVDNVDNSVEKSRFEVRKNLYYWSKFKCENRSRNLVFSKII